MKYKRHIAVFLMSAILMSAVCGCSEDFSSGSSGKSSGKKKSKSKEKEETMIEEVDDDISNVENEMSGADILKIYQDAVSVYGELSVAEYSNTTYIEEGSGVIAPFIVTTDGGVVVIILRQECEMDFPLLYEDVYIFNKNGEWELIDTVEVLMAGSNGSSYHVCADGGKYFSVSCYRRAGEDDYREARYKKRGEIAVDVADSLPDVKASVDGSNGLFIPLFDLDVAITNFKNEAASFDPSSVTNTSYDFSNTGDSKTIAENVGITYYGQGDNYYYNSADWGNYAGSVGGGCNVACITMVATSFGIVNEDGAVITPGDVAELNGGVYWYDSTYKKVGIKPEYRYEANGKSGQAQKDALAFLDECIERYQNDPSTYSPVRLSFQFSPDSNHYVLIVGKNSDGSYTCIDSNLHRRTTFYPIDTTYKQDTTSYSSYILGLTQYTLAD